MSLECLIVPESKKVLKNKKDKACQRDTKDNLKKLPGAKAETIKQQNK